MIIRIHLKEKVAQIKKKLSVENAAKSGSACYSLCGRANEPKRCTAPSLKSRSPSAFRQALAKMTTQRSKPKCGHLTTNYLLIFAALIRENRC